MIVLPADAVQIGGYLMIRVKTKHMLYHLISQCIYLRYGRIMCGWQNANYFWDPTDLIVDQKSIIIVDDSAKLSRD